MARNTLHALIVQKFNEGGRQHGVHTHLATPTEAGFPVQKGERIRRLLKLASQAQNIFFPVCPLYGVPTSPIVGVAFCK